MAKVILGKRPKSFKRTVSFALPGEEMGTIEVVYKYRTRTEFAAFQDEMQAILKTESEKEIAEIRAAAEKGEKVADVSQSEIVERQNDFSVRFLMGAIEGWNLDVPFDTEAVTQLVDELPAAVSAIVADYRAAIVEGRLGN
jgi:hypothetical protein